MSAPPRRADLLAAARLAGVARRDAERALHEAIVAAHADGFTMREVGEAADVSVGKVHAIVVAAKAPPAP